MKITKARLHQLIKEEVARLIETNELGDAHNDKFSEEAEYEAAEYDRGYQDGFDSAPPARDATADYDIGYEDGEGDATLPEPEIEPGTVDLRGIEVTPERIARLKDKMRRYSGHISGPRTEKVPIGVYDPRTGKVRTS